MNAGKIEQMGSPVEIYTRPASRFVVDFIGRANFLVGKVEEVSGDICVVSASKTGGLLVDCHPPAGGMAKKGDEIILSIRPEDVTVHREVTEQKRNTWECQVRTAHFLGDHWDYILTVGNETLWVSVPPAQRFNPGDRIYAELSPDGMRAWKTGG